MKYRKIKGKIQKLVFSRYRTINGVRRYHPKGLFYVFWTDVDKK